MYALLAPPMLMTGGGGPGDGRMSVEDEAVARAIAESLKENAAQSEAGPSDTLASRAPAATTGEQSTTSNAAASREDTASEADRHASLDRELFEDDDDNDSSALVPDSP